MCCVAQLTSDASFIFYEIILFLKEYKEPHPKNTHLKTHLKHSEVPEQPFWPHLFLLPSEVTLPLKFRTHNFNHYLKLRVKEIKKNDSQQKRTMGLVGLNGNWEIDPQRKELLEQGETWGKTRRMREAGEE